MSLRLGVDLGGTKIEIVALDDDGKALLRQRLPTPQNDYTATIAAIATLVEKAESQLGQRGTLGVGIPGSESRATGLIRNANSTCLIGKPLRRDLQTRLQREVRLANDANCFALSEASDGAGLGASVVFGVILGTGVGGGVVVKGDVLTGINGIAGEWGHNRLPGDETFRPPCYWGRNGCVETFLSGPAMSADHQRGGGTMMSPQDILKQAELGSSACEATLQRYESRLARALSQVINILDPDAIVLGGGLSNIDRLYVNVPRLWGEHVFSDQVATRLCKHRHGDSSGVRGAAWLWASRG